ncbi:MAG: hypothetical protein ABI988_21155 [Nitrospirota bacterium]
MTPAHRFVMATLSLTLSGLTWLDSPIPAQAAPIIDTFELKAPVKEWCQGNPKFFETFTVKAKDGVTVTFTQDPLNTGDVTTIHATINNTGSADIDAITMKGLAFPRNQSGHSAELVLSGTNPGNPDHFLTLRGQATFNHIGTLTKVTGTFVGQITGTYTIHKFNTQSGPVECFDSGTFGTGKKL